MLGCGIEEKTLNTTTVTCYFDTEQGGGTNRKIAWTGSLLPTVTHFKAQALEGESGSLWDWVRSPPGDGILTAYDLAKQKSYVYRLGQGWREVATPMIAP